MGWTHSASAVLASFLTSSVEFVEALTIVLAVSVTRGWRSAITGAFLGVAVLATLIGVFGTSFEAIPISRPLLFVGLLLLVFGMRWPRKAILRASGVLDLHDEAKVFARQTAALRLSGEFRNVTIDGVGFLATLKAVVIEGAEVVYIVIALGATGNMILPAGLRALAAGLLVILLGFVLHEPLTRVPENTLKFSVGVLLSALGVFWIGEGLRFRWFGQEWVIVALIIGFSSTALVAIRLIKRRPASVLVSGILLIILYCAGEKANAQVNAPENVTMKADTQGVNATVEHPTIALPKTQAGALPDAPQPEQVTSQSGGNGSHQAGTGDISGTVLDKNGDVLEGAHVTLLGSSSFGKRTVVSGGNGQFAFRGLPPDVYKITVSAQRMSTFTSPPIPLQSGEARIVPQITLVVSGGSTTVTVTGNKEELAEEQVRIAVQQRVVGVIPNFYSTYDWNAPPMGVKQKFHLGFRSVIDPVSFLIVAGTAGAEQYQNIFPAYGGGIEGYGKRYGAALANHVSATLLGKAVYPSIFHQDPRYFYKGKGSIRSRALYAMSAAVMARNDDGRWRPNYSNVLGNFSAGAISNLYYPESDRGASLVLLNGLADTGADAAANLIREFLLKGITTHVPKGANGQP